MTYKISDSISQYKYIIGVDISSFFHIPNNNYFLLSFYFLGKCQTLKLEKRIYLEIQIYWNVICCLLKCLNVHLKIFKFSLKIHYNGCIAFTILLFKGGVFFFQFLCFKQFWWDWSMDMLTYFGTQIKGSFTKVPTHISQDVHYL